MSNRNLTQPPAKILLNNTTSISLHDRFSKIQKARRDPPVAITKTINKDEQKTAGSAKNRRLAEQMANRPAVQAALKLKKKSVGVSNSLSVKQRIGAKVGTPTPGHRSPKPPAAKSALRQRLTVPVRKRIGGAQARTNLNRMNRRDNSTLGNGLRRRLNAARPQTNVNSGAGVVVKTAIYRRSNNNIPRGNGNSRVLNNNRRGGFGQQQRPPRIGGPNRTGNTPVKRLGGAGPVRSNNNNRGNNQRGNRRGGFNNRNGRGGRGGQQQRGGNRQGQGPVNKDKLNADLDSYMKQSRNHLDADLDTYMAQSH